MIAEATPLKDCYVLTPEVFTDERGYFFESFNKQKFEQLTGLDVDFVQDNQSKSQKGVLRGLHFQVGDFEQAKLIRVIKGAILDVCVDLRKSSSTFGQHFSITLNEENNQQLFVPRGFAHGFLVKQDDTIINYKCDNFYHKPSERGIMFNDKDLDINWDFPLDKIILSSKDTQLSAYSDYLNEH